MPTSHTVYVFDCVYSPRVKIGYTTNVVRRKAEHERKHGKLNYVRQWVFTTRAEAERFERSLHWHFRDHHIVSDWTGLGERQETEWFDRGVLHAADVDVAAVVRAYRDTRLVEARVPKAYLEALRERGLSVEDAIRMAATAEPHATGLR